MAATLSLTDLLIAKQHQRMQVAEHNDVTTLRFSWREILWEQHRIVGIWRSLNRNGKNPVAKTFLGRIAAISFKNS